MRGLILTTPEPMLKVRVITPKDYSVETLKTLQRVGVLHIEESEELKPVDRALVEQQRGEVGELLSSVENILGYVPPKELEPVEEDVEVIYTRPFSEIGDEVRTLSNKLSNLHQRITRLDDEAKQLAELEKYLGPLSEHTGLRLKDLSFSGEYLFSQVFIIPGEAYEALRKGLGDYLLESISAAGESETVFYAIAKAGDRGALESRVGEAGGRALAIPDDGATLPEFLAAAEGRLKGLAEETAKLYAELRSRAMEDARRLVLLREALQAEDDRLSVILKACESKYVLLVEGWIPEKAAESAVAQVKESLDYIFIDTARPAEQEEPPTKLRNPKALRPFQVIINLFATPKYREWDPTPIISYSFAFFFGLMVADVVYALGIMLLGRFLLSKFTENPDTESFRLFRRLVYICGGVALIVGLLTGSYMGDIYTKFGFQNPALVRVVQVALQDPLTFILLALAIGFVHVNLAHVIAFIKGIKERDKGMILNKIGLCALQFGIPPILHFMLGIVFPGFTNQLYLILAVVMVVGLLVVIGSWIMMRGGLGAILWLFDVTGILGDIMSYARLAGVGLATYYLASTFNQISALFSEIIPGVAGAIIGGILGIVIIVFGHLINMVLTAITGFIHSLRLCFVEFLFKFYEGGGREYSPFKLRKRAGVLLRAKS
ncbi:MAG: V-type ATPase 116kDa subunit family protein [Chloroflexota bacterium]